MALSGYDIAEIPKFEPLRCKWPSCGSIITGSTFVSHGTEEPEVLCEDCYWSHRYGNPSYIKTYKSTRLEDVVSSERSRRICRCEHVPHYDSEGEPLELFPIGREDKHLSRANGNGLDCGLVRLGAVIASAKHDCMLVLSKSDDQTQRRSIGLRGIPSKKKPTEEKSSLRTNGLYNQLKMSNLSLLSGATLMDAAATAAPAVQDDDVPPFLQMCADSDPFRNVPVSLRLGPLIISNDNRK